MGQKIRDDPASSLHSTPSPLIGKRPGTACFASKAKPCADENRTGAALAPASYVLKMTK